MWLVGLLNPRIAEKQEAPKCGKTLAVLLARRPLSVLKGHGNAAKANTLPRD